MLPEQNPFYHLVARTTGIAKRASGLVTARDAIGPLAPGTTVVGVTKGSFSMLDLIQHVLEVTGPADIDVSTWTMGVYDADVLWRFARSGALRSIRFMLDPSMFGRRQELSDAFVAAFGGDTMRAIDNHAKFTTIGNDAWRVTITSSMNLNRNRRLENFALFEDAGVYAFHRGIVDDVFAQVRPMWLGKKRTKEEYDALRFEGQEDGSGATLW